LIPSLAYSFAVTDLLQQMTDSGISTCDMCIAIHTKSPHFAIFRGPIGWIMQGRLVSRMATAPVIERYYATGEVTHQDTLKMWPLADRRSLQIELSHLCMRGGNEAAIIESPPAPAFVWTCGGGPGIERHATYDLVRRLSPNVFVRLPSELLRERSIIMYERRETVVCNAILALHFLLKPMEWISDR
jgi:hypothetical protein